MEPSWLQGKWIQSPPQDEIGPFSYFVLPSLLLLFYTIFFMNRGYLCFPSSQLKKKKSQQRQNWLCITEMHERQLMYLHKYRPWSDRDVCIKVNERFECIKLSVCVSLWQTETLKPAQTSWRGTDINLTLAMFHLALTKCDIQAVALKINTNSLSVLLPFQMSLEYSFLVCDAFLGKNGLN